MNTDEGYWLERVLQFVRLDGSEIAPVCFLTIEDGGNWKDLTADKFKDYFATTPSQQAPQGTSDTGKPGKIISKLMLALFSDPPVQSLDNWRIYHNDTLYRRNECNIKFFPIGRPNQGFWDPIFSEVIGLDDAEYERVCRQRRPEVIQKRYPLAFDGSQIHIVLGALEDWKLVLDPAGEALITEPRTAHWQMFKRDSQLAFAAFNIFRYGISDADCLAFAQELQPFVPEPVRMRVRL